MQADRQTGVNKQTDRYKRTDRQTDRQAGRQEGRHKDRQTARQTGRKAGRQTHRHTHTQTENRHTGRCCSPSSACKNVKEVSRKSWYKLGLSCANLRTD